jgi:hypothetical protein
MSAKTRPVGKAPQLKTPRILAIIPDYSRPLAKDRDDQEYVEVEILALNEDLGAFETARKGLNLGQASENSIMWLTFVAWHALRRGGDVDDKLSFGQFRKDCLQVRDADQDDKAEQKTVDPTAQASDITY